MKLDSSKKKGAVVLIVALLVVGSLALTVKFPTGMEGVRVAVYNGRGFLPSSSVALLNMFRWMNADANYVNSTDIQQGVLDDYDIVVFPGGSSFDYSNYLGVEGRNAIIDFVAKGGSFFGICGGSVFGTNSYLGLFKGYTSGAVNGSGIKLIPMTVNTDSTGPNLSTEPATYNLLYWNSGYFYSSNATYMSTVIPIVLYSQNNEPAMIACRHGNGTVFLSYPHPEYEEGSTRDGDSGFDYLSDSCSEWNLLLKVSLWLIQASK
ncbi:MAG: BPL-N domain-containing protein [Candidatus Odinarchaeota archaeon]